MLGKILFKDIQNKYSNTQKKPNMASNTFL